MDRQSPGMGRATTPISESRFDRRPVSGYPAALATLAQSAKALQSDGHKVALWLGASQLHAINEYTDGERLAVVVANARASERGATLRYVQISEANANLNEILSFYLQFRERGVKPDVLLVAIVYDDLKEPGVRRSNMEAVRPCLDKWRKIGGKGIDNLLAEAAKRDREGTLGEQAPVSRSPVAGTPQEALENALMKGLEGTWAAFHARDLARAATGIWVRTAVMSLLFRSNPRMRIVIPDDLAQWNLDALDSLLAIAEAEKVPVVLYRQPLGVERDASRYDQQAYEKFLADLADRCDRLGADCADFETLVPVE